MAETDIGPEDANATLAAPEPYAPESDMPESDTAEPHASEARRAERPERTEPPGSGRTRLLSAGWLVIAVPAAVSFAVGGYEIGGPSLWRDEAYTKDAIGRPVGQIFALLRHQDAVHGAYYLLMHVIAAAVGTSATALRFPSLCAMVIATGFVAAIGRRAAAMAVDPDAGPPGRNLDIPALTGLLSGLLFATAPYMTYYAQMARSYAIETMFATIASYLLLRSYPDGRWRWWWAYGAAVALTGLFNMFGLLILAAHGVTLLLTDARGQSPHARSRHGRLIGRIPLRWLTVSAAAVIVLGPLLYVAGHEQKQIDWLTPPNASAVKRLLIDMAGSPPLIIPFALLALAGLMAAYLMGSWRPLNPAAIALPWLVVPPVLLMAVSFVKPVYYVRYVEFCLPALSILAGAGLVGLIRFAAGTRPGGLRLAWLPAALVIAVLAALLAGPQQAIRQTAARPDNLRLVSAIVAANEQPGDVVFYIPVEMHVLGTGYPAPFLRLRDIALARSPIASATLTGTEITSPALLKSRFTDVRHVWVVTGGSNDQFPTPATPVDKEKMALLAGWHIIHRWQAGQVMLTLYGS
jgi:mannosyltransferase